MRLASQREKMKLGKAVGLPLAILLLPGLLSCSDGRPEATEARAQFQSLYPGVDVTDVQITEDEVVARSFRFRYRKKSSDVEKEIEIQFMKDDSTGRWGPKPAPPSELP